MFASSLFRPSLPTGQRKNVTFVSTMSGAPWGGSEMLWSEAALRVVRQGHSVAASVHGWPERPPQLSALKAAGVDIHERVFTRVQLAARSVRAVCQPIFRGVSRYAFVRWLAKEPRDLICISNGWIKDHLGIMNLCSRSRFPYVVVIQANAEHFWPDDNTALGLIDIFRGAKRVFFVSERNRSLLESQLGIELSNAELVWNPFNVHRDVSPPWPSGFEVVHLACVGRLEPEAKGQDLLLHVLASQPWRSRPIQLSFFGRGHGENGLRRLVERLGLSERVRFCGQVNDIEGIWESHHALVLPSRFEGLPLAAVEAMLCGRPVIATDVAGTCKIVREGVTGFLAESPTVRHLSLAMERAWQELHNWEIMGKNAAREIRELVPADPAADFAQRLLGLADSS